MSDSSDIGFSISRVLIISSPFFLCESFGLRNNRVLHDYMRFFVQIRGDLSQRLRKPNCAEPAGIFELSRDLLSLRRYSADQIIEVKLFIQFNLIGFRLQYVF